MTQSDIIRRRITFSGGRLSLYSSARGKAVRRNRLGEKRIRRLGYYGNPGHALPDLSGLKRARTRPLHQNRAHRIEGRPH